jgi:hypothetical protein
MKKKKVFLLYPLLLAMLVTSGGVFAAADSQRSGEKHREEKVCQKSKVSDGINEKELETHVKFLAHEDRGGRFPGTPGYMAAAEYVRVKLKEYGLEAVCQDETGQNSFFQTVPMRHFKYGKGNRITVKSPKGEKVFRNLTDFFFESAGEGGSRTITGTPVFIGCGIHEPGVWDDLASLDIKGKPVFLMQYFPPKKDGEHVLPRELRQKYTYGFYSLYKYPAVLERGASCIIHVLHYKQAAEWELNLTTSHCFALRPVPPYGAEWQFTPPVPEVTASKTMIDYFFADKGFDPIQRKGSYERFEFDGYEMTIELDVTEERINSPNVVGLVRGTDPVLKNTYIAVGAHLDHLGTFQGQVFNGANDNASACAALLAASRELVKNPPKRSVIFTFFTGEESCLSGSRYFVEHSPVPLKQIQTFINLDEVGGKKGDNSPMFIAVGALPKISTRLEKIMTAAGKHLDRAELKIDKTELEPYRLRWVDQFNDWVDHYSFLKKGIPIIGIGTIPGIGADWHTPGDDVETINFEHLHQVTRFIYALVSELGNR